MNILNFFVKSKKESIKWLEFFYCLIEVENYLKVEYGNSNNILIRNFIKLLDWCSSFLASQINDYAESLTDYVFWKSRQFYLKSMGEFVASKSNCSEFIDQVLYSMLFDRREGQSLGENFQSQLTLEVDSKSFQFSKIILPQKYCEKELSLLSLIWKNISKISFSWDSNSLSIISF